MQILPQPKEEKNIGQDGMQKYESIKIRNILQIYVNQTTLEHNSYSLVIAFNCSKNCIFLLKITRLELQEMDTLERNLTYERMLNLSVSGPSSYEVTKELRSFNQKLFLFLPQKQTKTQTPFWTAIFYDKFKLWYTKLTIYMQKNKFNFL